MSNRNFLEYEAVPVVPRVSLPLMVHANSANNLALRAFLEAEVTDTRELEGKRIAILATNGVEECEFLVPMRWAAERGATVHVVAPDFVPSSDVDGLQSPEACRTHILTVKFMENAGYMKVDRFLSEADSADYDACIIPGGAWSPDILRGTPSAVRFVQDMAEAGKILAAICHGAWVLINAGVVKGRRATGIWGGVQTDLANAGAVVVDEPVVVDGNLVTSRCPYDLAHFLRALSSRLKA